MSGTWRRFFGLEVFQKQDNPVSTLFIALLVRDEAESFLWKCQMKFIRHGKDSVAVIVTNISQHGVWLLTRDEELFISFNEFPRFQKASVSQIMNVEWLEPHSLYWPDLQMDLALQSIRRFPLVSKEVRLSKYSRRQA